MSCWKLSVLGLVLLHVFVACRASASNARVAVTISGGNNAITLNGRACLAVPHNAGSGCDVGGLNAKPYLGRINTLEIFAPFDAAAVYASFAEQHSCPRLRRVDAVSDGPGRWRVDPPGPAGRYDVILLVSTVRTSSGTPDPRRTNRFSFSMTTLQRGMEPGPTVQTGGLVIGDGLLEAPLALHVENLASNARPSATVTITGADGLSRSVPLAGSTCEGNGRADLTGAGSFGAALGNIGSPPYRLHYELVVAGVAHIADFVAGAGDSIPDPPNFVPPLAALSVGG
jgi:hypothetical protein